MKNNIKTTLAPQAWTTNVHLAVDSDSKHIYSATFSKWGWRNGVTTVKKTNVWCFNPVEEYSGLNNEKGERDRAGSDRLWQKDLFTAMRISISLESSSSSPLTHSVMHNFPPCKKSRQDETMATVGFHPLMLSPAWNGSIEQEAGHYLLDMSLVEKWVAVLYVKAHLIFDHEVGTGHCLKSKSHALTSEHTYWYA